MNKESALIIGLIVSGFLYFILNPTIGLVLAGFIILVFTVTTMTEKPKKTGSNVNYSIESPILIESTRQAPYRIPEKMDIQYKGDAKQGKPKYKKITDKGPLAYLGKSIGRLLKKTRDDL